MKLAALALMALVAGCADPALEEDLGGGDDSSVTDTADDSTDAGDDAGDAADSTDGADAGDGADDGDDASDGDDTGDDSGDDGGSALPDFHGRFGSPSIVRDTARLHAFFPIQGYQGRTVHVAHARSDDDGATWQRVGDALPRLGPGVKPGSAVWAPAAAKIGTKWVLYYSAVEKGTEQHFCVFRAYADRPGAAFTDDFAEPLVCPEGGKWAIDPYVVQDGAGDWWLEVRYDKPDHVNTISIRKLDATGRNFAPNSAWHELTRIKQGGWEEPVMENAAVVQLPVPGSAPHWFVFYSGGSYRNNTYAVGYADCGTSITGPCTKKTVTAPWLTSKADLKAFGPGTPTFWLDATGAQMMSVNTWKFSGGQENPDNQGQIMHTFEVHMNATAKPVATFVRRNE
jgi:hypothetical protein